MACPDTGHSVRRFFDMAQQKGMKRAQKVALRARKKANAKITAFNRQVNKVLKEVQAQASGKPEKAAKAEEAAKAEA
jgi:hypothetical protein